MAMDGGGSGGAAPTSMSRDQCADLLACIAIVTGRRLSVDVQGLS